MISQAAATSTSGVSRSTRVGAVRPSQLLHTYGVGALIDLPNFSVIVAGLQAWGQPQQFIEEPRLLAAVQAELGPQVGQLAAMPWKEDTGNPNDDWTRVGVPVLPFPRWFRCTACNLLSTIDGGLFKLKPGSVYRVDQTMYIHEGCQGNYKSPMAVPARFVTACTNGHLDEFPWVDFAHGYMPCPQGGGNLRLTEPGSGTRSTDVVVTCLACNKANAVSTAFDRSAKDGPRCRGRHPHLRSFDTSCDQIAQPLLLGASNTWFGIVRSTIAIPVRSGSRIDREVDALWHDIADPKIKDEVSLGYALDFKPSLFSLKAFPLNELWSAIERRRTSQEDNTDVKSLLDLKIPEWDCFIDPAGAPDTADFTIHDVGVPETFLESVAQVIEVTRLRVAAALTGFARIEPPEFGIGDEISDEKRVALTTETPFWVPASEVRGEGIFLRLPEDRVRSWEAIANISERVKKLKLAMVRRYGPTSWSGSRYVLLHSLAHLLINELALECGYGAASLRERIYASDGLDGKNPMAGILIYTAAADSEGTLGGLVAMAAPTTLGRVIDCALHRAELCSSDPLCAEHLPTPEDATLHGAACHSCLFLPETSCEANNRMLDRATLVETLKRSEVAYLGR